MPSRLSVFLIFITVFLQIAQQKAAQAKETIVVYSRTYDNAYSRKHIENFAELSKDDFGEFEIIKSVDMEQGRAFAELEKGTIDVIVSAPSLQREKHANVIYLPLDRGLLGFRICLVNKQSSVRSAIETVNHFIQRKLTIGVGTHWPDRTIFEDNGFKVVTSPILNSLYSMLEKQRFDCLTRSVNEIDQDLTRYADQGLISDNKLVFIYPNANFLFINPNNKKLYNRLSTGVGRSIENNSFYEIFDEFYENELSHHSIYKRKLVFLNNRNISSAAMSAINRFGLASFVTGPTPVKNKADANISAGN